MHAGKFFALLLYGEKEFEDETRPVSEQLQSVGLIRFVRKGSDRNLVGSSFFLC